MKVKEDAQGWEEDIGIKTVVLRKQCQSCFIEHQVELMKIATSVVGKTDALQVVTTAFEKVYMAYLRSHGTIKLRREFLRFYLNLAIKEHFSGKKDDTIPLEMPPEGKLVALSTGLQEEMNVEQFVLDTEERSIVRQYVMKLPASYQNIIALRFFAGYSVKETAFALHMSEGAVKVGQHRAIQKLKLAMGKDGFTR